MALLRQPRLSAMAKEMIGAHPEQGLHLLPMVTNFLVLFYRGMIVGLPRQLSWCLLDARVSHPLIECRHSFLYILSVLIYSVSLRLEKSLLIAWYYQGQKLHHVTHIWASVVSYLIHNW
jgi:hypothetical protein